MSQEILEAVTRGRATLKGVACEKPLARNVAEAKRIVELIEGAGLPKLSKGLPDALAKVAGRRGEILEVKDAHIVTGIPKSA